MEREMSIKITEENRNQAGHFIQEWLNENRSPLPLYEVEIDWTGQTHIEGLCMTIQFEGRVFVKYPLDSNETVYLIKIEGDKWPDEVNWISFAPQNSK